MRSAQPWLERSSHRLYDRCLPEPASAVLCKNGRTRSLFCPPLLWAQPLSGERRAGVLNCWIIKAISHNATWQATLQRRSQQLHSTEPPSLGVSRRGHAHKHAGIGGEERGSGFSRGSCRQKASDVSDGQNFLRFFFLYHVTDWEWQQLWESWLFCDEVPSHVLPSPRLHRVNNGFKYLPMSAETSTWRTVILIFPLKSYLIQ